MSGKKKMTMHQAQEIYYKIQKDNICFQSETGESFYQVCMKIQQMRSDNRLTGRFSENGKKKQNRKRLLSINRKIACIVSAVVLISCIVCINWNLLMDLRTNYQTKEVAGKNS